ncbi:MAG: DUF483 domain-containing protein [Candidatus Vogelbacteria bacterium]|nr:DUF483 domain-containing protein [Candidatus Vogelbacteria bacterium]
MDYEFIEWYKLSLDIRSDLLTVTEGIRSGANVELCKLEKRESQKKLLEFCLKRFGLVFRVRGDNYYISKSKLLLVRLWSGEIKTGEFLGYPKCCVAAFEEGPNAMILSSDATQASAVRYCRELEDILDGEDFDEVRLYNQHIPCSIHCVESLKMAKKNRAVLEVNDIEAANYLRNYNLNLVYRLAYKYPQGKNK